MCSGPKKTNIHSFFLVVVRFQSDFAPSSLYKGRNAKLLSVSVNVTKVFVLVSVRGSVSNYVLPHFLCSAFFLPFAPLRESTLQATHKWCVSAIEALGLFNPHQLQPPLGCFCPQNQLSCQQFLEAPQEKKQQPSIVFIYWLIDFYYII